MKICFPKGESAASDLESLVDIYIYINTIDMDNITNNVFINECNNKNGKIVKDVNGVLDILFNYNIIGYII